MIFGLFLIWSFRIASCRKQITQWTPYEKVYLNYRCVLHTIYILRKMQRCIVYFFFLSTVPALVASKEHVNTDNYHLTYVETFHFHFFQFLTSLCRALNKICFNMFINAADFQHVCYEVWRIQNLPKGNHDERRMWAHSGDLGHSPQQDPGQSPLKLKASCPFSYKKEPQVKELNDSWKLAPVSLADWFSQPCPLTSPYFWLLGGRGRRPCPHIPGSTSDKVHNDWVCCECLNGLCEELCLVCVWTVCCWILICSFYFTCIFCISICYLCLCCFVCIQ